MTTMLAIYITILGMVLGSFFNVVGLRIPVGKSVVRPPSQCGACHKQLTGRDLIPVFSFLLAGGRCRHCGAKVSVIYPLGEALTGLLFLWVYLRFGLTAEGIIGFLLVSMLIMITVADLKYMRIPNRILLFFLPILGALILIFHVAPLGQHVLGALLGGGVMLLLAWFGGMGMGDVKLFALCGFVVGFPGVILAFLAACLCGVLVGGILLLLGVIKRRQPIPFGPWLALGTLITYGYGSQIISGYLSLIG
ncbi:prepilin peptidase [Paenibacillus dakarensis]|uniref:prepilin peptidase n=1 Tax=Paenibacillus dakarensis TaxID=1527293 RepID=UPI0006D5522D|nr:A24 family peptidase [Paenibacillus dakarensis]